MAKQGVDMARSGVLRLLAGVRDGLSLSDQAGALKGLAPADQARAGRLAAAVLRHQSRADAVIGTYVTRKPTPQVADVLRLAVVEMLELGGAAHGVVDAAVSLTRSLGKKGEAAAGMVNAVLRKAAGHGGWPALPPQPMPAWLREPVAIAYGEDAALAIEAAHQASAPLDLTPKPGVLVEGADLLPTGSLRIHGPAQVSALPGFAAGDWWVQDAAAALPARPGVDEITAAMALSSVQLSRIAAVEIASAGNVVTLRR